MTKAATDGDARLLRPSSTRSFADVAHQTIIFDARHESERLVLELIDTFWMQRLRDISQTGNTRLVYMFAEHSRFGHCLGVAFLAVLLMKHLREHSPEMVDSYANAVAAAALLHDVGHVAPGSHLAEKVWSPENPGKHERLSIRIIMEDPEIRGILDRYDENLAETVCKILSDDEGVPPWTRSILSGGGWNADRGNWAIVDSAMCSVSYGRYNVLALIDAFRLSANEELVLLESRLDALTHFFVARDSMYRQVYQHRALQAVDALTQAIIRRARDLLKEAGVEFADFKSDTAAKKHCIARAKEILAAKNILADACMLNALLSPNYTEEPLSTVAEMTESWWGYHIQRWCHSNDQILSDLSQRLRYRRLFKTVRIEDGAEDTPETHLQSLMDSAVETAIKLGYDPRYYVLRIEEKDKHRGKSEEPPMALLENGAVTPVTAVEPMIDQIMRRSPISRTWLAVPKSIKEALGRYR